MDHLHPRATARPSAVAVALPARGQVVAVLMTLALVAAALVTGAATAPSAGAASVEDTFTNKINKARTARGIPRLATRGHLVDVARRWAAQMASQSKLYHNPRLTSDVSNWRWVGENVGYGPTAPIVHRAFMNSAGHRANILSRNYSEVGVGAVVRGGRVWVAEVFRRPKTSSGPAYTEATFRHALRYGSKGAAVKRVQARLGLRRTGFYGKSTKAAVARFQRDLGWRGRGNTGRKTWARLF